MVFACGAIPVFILAFVSELIILFLAYLSFRFSDCPHWTYREDGQTAGCFVGASVVAILIIALIEEPLKLYVTIWARKTYPRFAASKHFPILAIAGTMGFVIGLNTSIVIFETAGSSAGFTVATAVLLTFIETPVQIMTGYYMGIQIALKENFNHNEITTFHILFVPLLVRVLVGLLVACINLAAFGVALAMYIVLGVASPLIFSVYIAKRQALLPQSFVQQRGYLQLYGSGVPESPDEDDEFPVPYGGGNAGGEVTHDHNMGVVQDAGGYKGVNRVATGSKDSSNGAAGSHAHESDVDAKDSLELGHVQKSAVEHDSASVSGTRSNTHSHTEADDIDDLESVSIERAGHSDDDLSRSESDDDNNSQGDV